MKRAILPLVIIGMIVGSQERSQADVDQDDIRRTIEKEMKQKKPAHRPSFSKPLPRDSTRTYRYDLADSPFPANIPFDYPTNLQRTISLLRRYESKRFERRLLRKAEKFVDEELELLEDHKGDRDELMRKLKKLDDEAFSILTRPVERYARSQGWKPLRIHTVPTGLKANVTVITQPEKEKSKVYYMKKWSYDNLDKKLRKDYRQWREAGATSKGRVVIKRISGKYHFFAVWPNLRKSYISSDFNIVNQNSVIRLTAD